MQHIQQQFAASVKPDEPFQFGQSTILRMPSVKERTGLSRSSIYFFEKQGTFPKRISLGPRAVGWDSAQVDAWIKSKIAASTIGGK